VARRRRRAAAERGEQRDRQGHQPCADGVHRPCADCFEHRVGQHRSQPGAKIAHGLVGAHERRAVPGDTQVAHPGDQERRHHGVRHRLRGHTEHDERQVLAGAKDEQRHHPHEFPKQQNRRPVMQAITQVAK